MKDELRKQLKIRRALFQGEARERADIAICEKFLSSFSRYESFFIYNVFSSEADTKRITGALLDAGKRVYLPRVEGLHMRSVPYGKTQIGAYGIEEPSGQAFEGEIQVTVVPLLAVNKKLYRIGYGKGYYDRYLKNRRTLKIGLGYSFQIEEFKEDEWDEPLDAFVCEKEIYEK